MGTCMWHRAEISGGAKCVRPRWGGGYFCALHTSLVDEWAETAIQARHKRRQAKRAALAAVAAATEALIHTARRDAERGRCSAGMMAAVERLDAAEARLRETRANT